MSTNKWGRLFLFSRKIDFGKLEGGIGSTFSDGSGYFDGEN